MGCGIQLSGMRLSSMCVYVSSSPATRHIRYVRTLRSVQTSTASPHLPQSARRDNVAASHAQWQQLRHVQRCDDQPRCGRARRHAQHPLDVALWHMACNWLISTSDLVAAGDEEMGVERLALLIDALLVVKRGHKAVDSQCM